ncbi:MULTISPECIES: hypothetical protein [Giesbergeria]|uniref:SAYSvFN domain-containing protein n=1 Tax=Giesbergeria sinuosa TaxID=80883 RepID=A0ABV9QG60_9BURK
MSLNPYQNNWDTPPNGDFVRYLEHLTTAAPPPTASPQAPSTSSTASSVKASKATTTTAQPTLPLATQWAAVLSALHKGRTVLLWLTLAHLAAWLLLDHGSVPLLILMVAVWFAGGRALAALSDQAPASDIARSGLQRLQQEIRSLAQRRHHERKN